MTLTQTTDRDGRPALRVDLDPQTITDNTRGVAYTATVRVRLTVRRPAWARGLYLDGQTIVNGQTTEVWGVGGEGARDAYRRITGAELTDDLLRA
jgi:hypothetical protein